MARFTTSYRKAVSVLLATVFIFTACVAPLASLAYATPPLDEGLASSEATQTVPIPEEELSPTLPRDFAVVPGAISTDTTLYYGIVNTARTLWSQPTTTSIEKGNLAKDAVVAYRLHYDDGSWLYTMRGSEKLYFKGHDMKNLPRQTSTNTTRYAALTLKTKSYCSAPSAKVVVGKYNAGTMISYYQWTADGSWLYSSDSNGNRIFFRSTDLLKLPSKTSTDPKVYYGLTQTKRTVWSAPSTRSKNMGSFAKGTFVSYYKWSADGTWLYSTNGNGQRIFFKGNNIELVPAYSAPNKTVYYAVVMKARSFWSAPSIRSTNRGSVAKGSFISYYKWTADGKWMYSTDGNGRRIFFKGNDLLQVPGKTSKDDKVYTSVVNSARSYWAAPSIQSTNRGPLNKGAVVSYRKWTADGKWLYRTDAQNRRVFFKGNDLSKYTGPVYYGTYIDVNLSEQKLRYIVDGSVVLSTDIVTGKPSTPTPAGTFSVINKQSPATLVGPGYAAPVSYWMPFTYQGHGFHDANWQPYFGGSRWTYGGSHGCVNMPFWAAQDLYWRAPVGSRVSIHW